MAGDRINGDYGLAPFGRDAVKKVRSINRNGSCPAVEEACEDHISEMRKSAKKSRKAFHRGGEVDGECQPNCCK